MRPVWEEVLKSTQMCLDWRKGRRVVELSLLADTMFCVMCRTRLHLCDTINETKQGTGSVLKLNVQTLCAMPNNIPTGTRDEKGAFEIQWKVVIGKKLLAHSAHVVLSLPFSQYEQGLSEVYCIIFI